MSEICGDNKKTSSAPFCTCVDFACPNNPANHGRGCTPCVAACVAKREIPVCFYRKQQPDMSRDQDYSFEGFARFIMTGKSR
ncbi:DUF6485 family protein [Cloacibacillus sp. An23]|uniref:DUF6485 family protein n=1 Tax=Cloacibacillus sp. An23 TaxID=1965591 RepID=UPI000B38A354|nr:DUF6485 family protein [Cloacibacillus sp. An23]OUO94385.1 hypothetical protein B5F39_03935 [Cloacibacillus sp. An23]